MFQGTIVRGLLAASIAASAVVARAVTIDLTPVGNPGNAGELSGVGAGGHGNNMICGAVGYDYGIGKYEVTAGQYTEFLNAKAKSDPYGLYTSYMDTSFSQYGCGIVRSGSDGHYSYTVSADRANRPVNEVTYWNACRFVNWLSNGQGNGDTETGTYTLNGYRDEDGRNIARNPGSKWFLPTENEWYKAAYYDPNKAGGGGYWDYPTGTNTVPSNTLSNPDPGTNANFTYKDINTTIYTLGAPYWYTEVGAFGNSASAYGTFDQGGNVAEWTESVAIESESADRMLRGGSYWQLSLAMRACERDQSGPIYHNCLWGFRVASVPEPGSVVLLLSGIASLAAYVCLRRKPSA
jgi:formylglycine-generating enzyme